MAGTWMSVVEGFGGMRVRDGKLSFTPQIPAAWERYSFKIKYRSQVLTVSVSKTGATFNLDKGKPLSITVHSDPMIINV